MRPNPSRETPPPQRRRDVHEFCSLESRSDDPRRDAKDKQARLVILRLDTPGGAIATTREMISDLLAARLPVVVYVSPDGARAGSAGLFITMASDVAAMAPQTNIGSASPILVGPQGPARDASDSLSQAPQ